MIIFERGEANMTKGRMKQMRYFLGNAGVALFILLPLGSLFLWSVAANWPWPLIFPQQYSIRGWKYLLNSSTLHTLGSSLFLSTLVTVLTLIIAFPAAKALAFYNFFGKKFFELIVFLPVLVPPVTIATGVHVQFLRWGVAGTYGGVIWIQLIPGIPYAVRILQNVFEVIGEQMEQEAIVLGATRWQSFRFVLFPMLLPGIVAAGIMVFIVSFSQYFLTFLIGGGVIQTFSMILFPLVQNGDRVIAAVFSLVFIYVCLFFLILVEKLMDFLYQDRLKLYTYL